MNILFIMYDQLRFDYLSCAGHPHLHTPNFDRVAAMGVRFTNAYCQSPVCGAYETSSGIASLIVTSEPARRFDSAGSLR